MKAVSTEAMRELDSGTIEAGTPGEVLMERAGKGAFRELRTYLNSLPLCHRQRITVFAGKGNNGGDGYVVARHAAEAGMTVTVAAVCPPSALTGDAFRHAQRLPESVQVNVAAEAIPNHLLSPGTIVVDALLGTGIQGALRPPYRTWIRQINSSGLPVVALDIPSGLNGDSGTAADETVRADLTVTMGLPKIGLFKGGGPEHCGRIRCVDIGLAKPLVDSAASEMDVVMAADIAPLLGRRPADGHKRTFGRVVVVGGSADYAGAPLLAGEAALRAGAGLSTVVMPAAAAQNAARGCLALIHRSIPDGGRGRFTKEAGSKVGALAAAAEAVVAGPGMTHVPEIAHVLTELTAVHCPLVLDADALRILAARPQLLAGRKGETVLTPHPGEMRALLEGMAMNDQLAAPRVQQATAMASAAGCYVVLKGQGTVLASPDGCVCINTTGRTSLSTAGTGDVLAGMIAGFLAQKHSPWNAVRTAVFLHGLAGEIATLSDRALIADDLLALIGPAMRITSPLC